MRIKLLCDLFSTPAQDFYTIYGQLINNQHRRKNKISEALIPLMKKQDRSELVEKNPFWLFRKMTAPNRMGICSATDRRVNILTIISNPPAMCIIAT